MAKNACDRISSSARNITAFCSTPLASFRYLRLCNRFRLADCPTTRNPYHFRVPVVYSVTSSFLWFVRRLLYLHANLTSALDSAGIVLRNVASPHRSVGHRVRCPNPSIRGNPSNFGLAERYQNIPQILGNVPLPFLSYLQKLV